MASLTRFLLLPLQVCLGTAQERTRFDIASFDLPVAGWKANAPIAALGKAIAAQEAAPVEARQMADLTSDNLSRQAALRGQQLHFEMMQNVLRMHNDTMRIMTSNLGGNTRYEYRW